MEHNMILSVSGWRKVFAESGNEEDKSPSIGVQNKLLCALIGETFAQYLIDSVGGRYPFIAVGTDTRPTSAEIADAILRALLAHNISVHYTGVASAPEIMAYARQLDGFLYISASHNPIGHNGIKFGRDDGGVLESAEAKKLIAAFEQKCADTDAAIHAQKLLDSVDDAALTLIYNSVRQYKREALAAYDSFIRTVITGSEEKEKQDYVFSAIKSAVKTQALSVVCDMNGSSRILSIDKNFLPSCGITLEAFNNEAGHIAHAIIPEPENLIYCSEVIQDRQRDGDTEVKLGYMPDCDGDRGNIVYWNEKTETAEAIAAQKVFALCVMAESAFDYWSARQFKKKSLLWHVENFYGKKAVVVNGPTSMQIDEICKAFGMQIFRAEVGEANVVNLAREKREAGYAVRILGEGSNGGNITYPSSVRDPLATLFAIIKLLTIRDKVEEDGTVSKGLFHIWCDKSDQSFKYKDDFTLADILDTLPVYITTGVNEERAKLKIKSADKGLLKEKFHQIFTEEWAAHKDELEHIYGFSVYEADITNGTVELKNAPNWNNATGGLKIRFLDEKGQSKAFIWMRPSGTENVFRVLCDVKGDEDAAERSLLRWESSMIRTADDALCQK